MDKMGFETFLRGRDYNGEKIDEAVVLAKSFEAFLHETGLAIEPSSAAHETTLAFSTKMIEQGTNTWDNYVALLRYGRFIGNEAVVVTVLDLVDGAEALGNLFEKLAAEQGEELRDRIFEGIDLPPLGTPNRDKQALMGVIMRRLEKALDQKACIGLLKDSLRDLEDAWYLDARKRYEEAGSLDAYLERRRAEFLAQLEKHRDEGTLFFSQPINDAVIDYVKAHPEVSTGIRVGNRVIEAKIPHEAIKFLEADDPVEKAYHYCHCPWAKESLRNGVATVSPTFCNCSAGFHKKSFEVIFGQPLKAEVLESVLAGDPWCKFAIELPEGVE